MRRAISALAIGAVAACSYRPARFADAPPVVRVADDAPTPVLRPRDVFEPIEIADVYVRRPLMDALDAERYPDAEDVNARDEVPPSSWFDPPADPRVLSREGDAGPPVPPFAPIATAPLAQAGGFVVEDARGVRWEMRVDEADRPEMRTAAAAIASRLVRALGWRAPEVHVTTLAIDDLAWTPRARKPDGDRVDVEAMLRTGPLPIDGRFRVAATRWPVGIDEGETPIGVTRRNDPNDKVPHRDRRTQRALQVLGAWLAIADLGPKKTRDAYVGAPGEGHLEHFLVGLDDAIGAGDVVRPLAPGQPPPGPSGLVANFAALGLITVEPPAPTPTRFPSVGAFEPDVAPGAFRPSLPFEPIDRLLPADAWWAAHRILSLPGETLAAAVDAGRLSDPEARAWLVKTLEARRRRIGAFWAVRVTPFSVERELPDSVVLRDEACAHGFAAPGATRVDVQRVDEDGKDVAPPASLAPTACLFRVPFSAAALRAANGYLVIRLRAVRGGAASARAFEVHVAGNGATAHVVGLRH